MGEVWVSQNERNISRYNKKDIHYSEGFRKENLCGLVHPLHASSFLSLTFTEIQCSLVFLLCLSHFFICDRISTVVFAVISSWGPALHAFSCQNTHTAGRWCSLSLFREHAAKKKHIFLSVPHLWPLPHPFLKYVPDTHFHIKSEHTDEDSSFSSQKNTFKNKTSLKEGPSHIQRPEYHRH